MNKYIKFLSIIFAFVILCGCNKNSSLENINIYTTTYPIEYITNRLYSDHSTIKSIYPNGVDINEYKVTDVLLSEYSNADMFIFNGLSKEQDYIKPMLKENSDLKIIDVTTDMRYKYDIEELWLDPANMLTLANNIKKGFGEYISAKYLKDEIENNYKDLKVDLTTLEANYRKTIKNASNLNIIVSDDIFLFLNKYGANVISIDQDNPDYEKNIEQAQNLIANNNIKYIYLKDLEERNDDANALIVNTNVQLIHLNTLSTLTDEQRNNYDYLTLMTENLTNLKKQLYNMD